VSSRTLIRHSLQSSAGVVIEYRIYSIFSYSWNESRCQTKIEELRKLNLITSGSNCFRRNNFRGNLNDDADAGQGS
jgi:hypothetical protein